MATPKKIVIQDLELADKEIVRLRKENKKLMINGILTQKERDKNGMDSMALQIENKRLRKENKDLKKYIKALEIAMENKEKQIDKLKQYEAMYKVRGGEHIYEEGLYN